MFPANAYTIRYATVDDVSALRRLAELDGQRQFCGPALIGEIDGEPAAALSLRDGSIIADPFRHTAGLTPLLRLGARSLHALSHTRSLRERLLAGVRPVGVAA
jgi:hypothetical protein